MQKYNYTPPVQSDQPKDWSQQVDERIAQNTQLKTGAANPEGPLGGVANFIGGGKLAQGVGQTIANAGGAQDASIQAQDQGADIQGQLLQRIKENKSQGKDTSRLESALTALGGNLQSEAGETTDLGTGGLENKQVIGSALQLGANLIPGAAKGAGLLEKGLVGAGTGYAMDVANKLQNKDTSIGGAFVPGAGTVVGATLPFAGALVSSLSKKIAGFTAGTGEQVIQRAIDNPDAIGEAVSKYANTPEAKQTLVDRAKSVISSFIQSKSEEYGTSLNKLGETTGSKPVSVTAATNSFATNIEKFGGTVSEDGNKISFANSTLTKSDQGALKSVFDTIKNWTDESPQGLDGLRQAIKNHMDDFSLAGNDRANVVLGAVEKDLKEHLSTNLPGYSDMLSSYSSKSQVIRDVVKELQVGGSAKTSTQLSNVMRIFQKDPALQSKLETIMGKQESEKFLNDISGAILSEWVPPGKLGNYIRGLGELGAGGAALATGGAAPALATGAVGLAASSPRIVGAVARTAGQAAKFGVDKIAQRGATMAAANTGQ